LRLAPTPSTPIGRILKLWVVPFLKPIWCQLTNTPTVYCYSRSRCSHHKLPFSPTAWIRSNPSKGVDDYPNEYELPRRSRHKSQRQGTDILGSQGDGTYRGDSTDRIVDADGKWSRIDHGNSSTHDVSLSNTPSSNSFTILGALILLSSTQWRHIVSSRRERGVVGEMWIRRLELMFGFLLYDDY